MNKRRKLGGIEEKQFFESLRKSLDRSTEMALDGPPCKHSLFYLLLLYFKKRLCLQGVDVEGQVREQWREYPNISREITRVSRVALFLVESAVAEPKTTWLQLGCRINS